MSSFLEAGKTFMTMLTNRINKSDPTQLPRLVIKSMYFASFALTRQCPCCEEGGELLGEDTCRCSNWQPLPPDRQHQWPVLGVNGALDDSRAQSLSHPQPSSFSS